MRDSYAMQQSRVPLVLCIVLFVVTFFLNNDFGIRYIYNYGLIAVILVCSILFDGVLRFSRTRLMYAFLAAVVIMYSLLPSSIRDSLVYNTAISMTLFTICCFLAEPSDRELKISAKIILFWGCVVFFYLMVVKLFPGIYWGSIFPHLSSYTQERAVDLMRNHAYGVAMGGSAVYIDYIFALGIFICAGAVFGGLGGKKIRITGVMLACVYLLGMVVQNRRSELLAVLLAGCLILILCADPDHIGAKKIGRITGAAGIVLAGIAVMFSRGMLDRYVETFMNLSRHSSGGIEAVGNGRIALWTEAYRLFSESPLFGIGWCQFSAHNHIQYMEGNNVHNDYLQLLCETGIIGVILIVTPFLYLWIKAMLRCWELNKMKRAGIALYRDEAMCYAIISCGIQTFFIVMHCFDPCFYKLVFWPIFTLAIIMYNLSYRRIPIETDE